MEKQAFTNKRLYLTFFLSFISISFLMLTSTYSDALFLSVYPRKWLSYYFLILPIATLVIYQLLMKLIYKASELKAGVLIFVLMGILWICYFLLSMTIFLMPFILSLLLLILSGLVINIVGNSIAAAFDIRSYKEHVFQINLAGTLGGIIANFTTPLITKFYSTQGVFYTAMILMTLIAVSVLNLKKLPEGSETTTTHEIQPTLGKDSYFYSLFAITLFITLTASLVDFAFKNSLLGNYSGTELTNFIGIFKGSVSVLTIIAQMMVSKRILTFIGLTGMLLILPISLSILGIATAIAPIFVLFLSLKAVNNITVINFSSPCLQMLLNPYPSQLRNKVSLVLGGYAKPIAGLLSAVIIYVINQFLPLQWFGIFLTLFSLALIFFVVRSASEYKDKLYHSIKEYRFVPDFLNLSPEVVSYMEPEILGALRSSDANLQRTGLSFFDDPIVNQYLANESINSAIVDLLQHPAEDIRMKAAISLRRVNAKTTSNQILYHLEIEQDEAAGFALLKSILYFGVLCPSEKIESYLQSDKPHKIAYAVITLSRSSDPAVREKAEHVLNKLWQGNPTEKLTLALTENYLPASPAQNERLLTLIYSEDNQVSIEAIKALKPQTDHFFVPILINFLNIKEKSHYAELELLQYKTDILNQLVKIDLTTPSLQKKAMIRLLARLSYDERALSFLIQLDASEMLLMRLYIAHQLARFFISNYFTPKIRQTFVNVISNQAQLIADLLKVKTTDERIAKELQVQVKINRQIFITWFGMLTSKKQVDEVAYYLEKPEQYSTQQVAKAYELLESLAKQAELRYAVALISKLYSPTEAIEKTHTISPVILKLAHHHYNSKIGHEMNTMDKASLLRRVKLFQDIPLESLLVMAEITKQMNITKGQIIFSEGGIADNLYCIVSGEIRIQKGERILSTLTEADYFGELGLLDEMPRTANAVANADGVLLFIEKTAFITILEDLPEIMQSIVAQIIQYLRQNLNAATY